MSEGIAKFHNVGVKPPKGGWSFTLNGQQFAGSSESEVAGKLKKWRVNNLTFVSDVDIERELWAYWCGRQPERCYQGAQRLAAPIGEVRPAELTKEMQGRSIWIFLNTIGAAWEPSLHPLFVHICDSISVILQCPLCRLEWQEVLRDLPPDDLSSRLAVCRWVWTVHNIVNSKIGKPEYPWSAAVSQWGFPMP